MFKHKIKHNNSAENDIFHQVLPYVNNNTDRMLVLNWSKGVLRGLAKGIIHNNPCDCCGRVIISKNWVTIILHIVGSGSDNYTSALIGLGGSHDPDTGLWLVQRDHMTQILAPD